MKTVFKKIEEIANLVSKVPNRHKGACIILATLMLRMKMRRLSALSMEWGSILSRL